LPASIKHFVVEAEVQKNPAAAFYTNPQFGAQSIQFILSMMQASQIA
jgi:hypothetical protein